MKNFNCKNCEKLFTHAHSVKRHMRDSCKRTNNNDCKSVDLTKTKQTQQSEQNSNIQLSTDNIKIVPDEPTFMLQFNPVMDGMYLSLFQRHITTYSAEAQKFLLEKRHAAAFIQYTKKVLKNVDDEPVLIIIQFKYVGRNNKTMIGAIEHNTILNGKSITKDYSNKILQPIFQKMNAFEKENDVIVLNMQYMKVYFKNLQPLDQGAKQQITQINSKKYEMNDDCNFHYIEENDDIPGFRNV